jgi:putative oxidoreductase
MSLSRRAARPLLAAIFIAGGLDAMRNPDGKVKLAEVVTKPLAQRVPSMPQDTKTLVEINGAIQVGAGVLLAIGRFRRLAALALIGSIIPTTYAGHRFWEENDLATKAQQKVHFLKNMGLLGGLILAAVDTDGAPSLGWRAKRGVHRAGAAGAAGVGRAGELLSMAHDHLPVG